VASETLQLRVVLLPVLMLVGLAVKELITGKEGGCGPGVSGVGVGGVIGVGAPATATVADLVTLPAALIAVRV
jgi:hypothetical protein